jgi:hypothetical protein
MSDLKVSTYIITSVAARSTGLAALLVIMSVSILQTDVILYIFFSISVQIPPVLTCLLLYMFF